MSIIHLPRMTRAQLRADAPVLWTWRRMIEKTVESMHIHNWKWSDKNNQWACSRCNETVTLVEFRAEYGQTGNLDVDPIAALNRLASLRRKRQDAQQKRTS